MVSYSSHSQTPANGPSGSIDPYVLFEALTGRKFERTSLPSRPAPEGYDDLSDIRTCRSRKLDEPEPDPQPEDLSVGCINPFALAENMVGHKIDRRSITAIRIIQDTLQTDYEELFDMKHHSVLYAGLKLNRDERMAEELEEGETKILKEKDLVTPDLSRLEKLGDLEDIGLKEVGDVRIKRAGILNNKLHLVLHANKIAKTVGNREVTQTINDFCLPFRRDNEESFTPPNSSWRDAREIIMMRNMRRGMISDYNTLFDYGGSHEIQVMRKFDDPIQGATANSWFVAALFSVYWADPAIINRTMESPMRMRDPNNNEDRQQNRFRVKFHDKGGRNNNTTQTVEVDYRVPVNNSSEDFVYCRSSDGMALWPSLYEKAFAKWISNGDNDKFDRRKAISSSSGDSKHVDITQLHHGDPVKAMAQINGREPEYYFTDKREASDLVGLVRSCSVNHRTICPMVAWTYATDRGTYRGCNLVANHAYSVLGWSSVGQGDKQYIIIRNPWGTTEPHGLTSYPGILTRVEPEYWRPASLLDREGVMAVEVGAFKEYFACMGIAK
ncbi:hypothetical protein FHL15_003826 [Xylaria flabelliformis]|uniref:Calpain catalytic domain-containing protein n=1 Tax=Xylaria flabelliformis TaxID=2512241 RepID=A0A553I4K6_9PEZI|nr:hypothetical protein FHL15_003826 [Xylaria flabelliformis]